MFDLERFPNNVLYFGLVASISIGLACGDDGSQNPTTSTSATGSTSSASTPTTSSGVDSSGESTSGSESTADTTSDSGVVCDGDDGSPSALSEIDGVWDAPRGRMVFFGGDQGTPVMCMSQTDFVAQTWAFRPDCDEFDLIDDGAQGPSARGRYATAHDLASERMYVHGGRFRAGTSGPYTLHDDTWVLDLTTDTWSQIETTGPSPRTNHIAVVAGSQLLVFGGNASTNGAAFIPLVDLWSMDLDTQVWQELPSKGGPSPRLFHAATVSTDGAFAYVYGGGDENAFLGPFFGDLWAYEIATGSWTLLHDGSGTAPIGSIWGDLLYDEAGGQLLLWGAHEDNDLGNNNKIWSFDLSTEAWTTLEEGDMIQNAAAGFCDFPVDFVAPDLAAPERRNAGAAVLTDTAEIIVFGGKTDCGIIDDVWTWSLDSQEWDNRVRASEGEICVRAFAEGCTTMCF